MLLNTSWFDCTTAIDRVLVGQDKPISFFAFVSAHVFLFGIATQQRMSFFLAVPIQMAMAFSLITYFLCTFVSF